MIVGMALLGLLVRFFESVFRPSQDARHLVFYVPVFLHLVKLESDVTIFLVGLVQLLLFLALTSWLVFDTEPTGGTHQRKGSVDRRVPGERSGSLSAV